VNPYPFDYEILKRLVVIKVSLFSTALNIESFVSSSEEGFLYQCDNGIMQNHWS